MFIIIDWHISHLENKWGDELFIKMLIGFLSNKYGYGELILKKWTKEKNVKRKKVLRKESCPLLSYVWNKHSGYKNELRNILGIGLDVCQRKIQNPTNIYFVYLVIKITNFFTPSIPEFRSYLFPWNCTNENTRATSYEKYLLRNDIYKLSFNC